MVRTVTGQAAGAGPETALSDEEIVRRVLGGDKDSYAILVRRHQGRVTAVVSRFIRDRDSALEVAHEAFVKAWQHLARYDPAWRFSTWLYAIASNAAIDHLRRRKHAALSLDEPISLDGEEIPREIAAVQDSAADILEGRQLAERLEAAIDELPPAFRRLILLRHPGGKSYEEIAAITKLPMGTVKNRIFRARQALKERLGNILPADV
jgi:RNA polymerase sigma-70 factor (ECF subfamily)